MKVRFNFCRIAKYRNTSSLLAVLSRQACAANVRGICSLARLRGKTPRKSYSILSHIAALFPRVTSLCLLFHGTPYIDPL
jgi:hypothetical protein